MTLYPRVDLTRYIVLSLWFGCNNDCRICMLSGLKRKLPAIGLDLYKRSLLDIVKNGRYENLILSGAEVTTFDELDQYAQFARSLGWFKKIQIQTNGRKLRDRKYLQHLIDCGVNEFFVSVHGLEEVHDATTRTPGAFQETMEGLQNLEGFNVQVITNTVLTRANLHQVAPLLARLSGGRITEIHLWNFFPMERTDSRDLVVSMRDFAKLLPELLSIARAAGKALVLKSFPECLSLGEPGFFDSLFPVTLLPEKFWTEFSECGFGRCIHRNRCRSRECWGLSSAYIRKYGDERNLLRPR